MRGRRPSRALGALVALVLACACGFPARPGGPAPALGQQVWKDGVSSYLFGTNDTVEWDTDSLLTDPQHRIVPALAAAHVGLVRSFFFHFTLYDDDNFHRTTIGRNPAGLDGFSLKHFSSPSPQPDQLPGNFYEIERRVSTIEHVGAGCLGVLPSIRTDPANLGDYDPKHRYVDPVTGRLETDLQFDEEVVAYLGHRCNLYEFGNEPDYNDISEPVYVQRWNEFVPRLKAINPQARFIGPVTASDSGMNGSYMMDFLRDVAAGRVNPVPDAISFHAYPCEGVDPGSRSQCFGSGSDFGVFSLSTSIARVRGWMRQVLGRTLPLGITEWNADPGSNPYMENAAFMTEFTRDALQAMIDARLDFAAEFDAQSSSGYCHLDMFDSCSGTDRPKAQFTEMASVISRYYPGRS